MNAAQTEMDVAKRKQLYAQLNDLLLDESFVIPVVTTAPVNIARASVHGFALRQRGGGLFGRVARQSLRKRKEKLTRGREQ